MVGGSVSAADIVTDIHGIVKGPLYSAQRRVNEALVSVWKLPGVVSKGQVKRIFSHDENGVGVEFQDGSTVVGFDKIIFATGFKVSYPYLVPNPVTPTNRLAGVYEHIVKIGDPTLTFVGQVCETFPFLPTGHFILDSASLGSRLLPICSHLAFFNSPLTSKILTYMLRYCLSTRSREVLAFVFSSIKPWPLHGFWQDELTCPRSPNRKPGSGNGFRKREILSSSTKSFPTLNSIGTNCVKLLANQHRTRTATNYRRGDRNGLILRWLFWRRRPNGGPNKLRTRKYGHGSERLAHAR